MLKTQFKKADKHLIETLEAIRQTDLVGLQQWLSNNPPEHVATLLRSRIKELKLKQNRC